MIQDQPLFSSVPCWRWGKSPSARYLENWQKFNPHHFCIYSFHYPSSRPIDWESVKRFDGTLIDGGAPEYATLGLYRLRTQSNSPGASPSFLQPLAWWDFFLKRFTPPDATAWDSIHPNSFNQIGNINYAWLFLKNKEELQQYIQNDYTEELETILFSALL